MPNNNDNSINQPRINKPRRTPKRPADTTPTDNVPKRFKNGKKSFLARISDTPRNVGIRSFGAFPQDVEFTGKDVDEDIVLVVRRSPASFIAQYLGFIFLLISSVMVFPVLSFLGLEGGSLAMLGLGGAMVIILIAITLAVDTFMKWYFSVNIVTNQRVIDVDFVNVLFHRFSEAQLERIEDVSHSVGGLMGSLFDYGSVYIQTAGSNPEFEFENIPRPRDVQDTILDLLEMKQKGDM